MPLTSEQIEVQRLKFESQDWSKYDIFFERDDLGSYIDFHAEIAFKAWLSAIESVEIELPAGFIWQSEGGDDVIYIADLEQSIEHQGYKVKP